MDGLIGGYNFQAAWSTGWLAGESAAFKPWKKRQEPLRIKKVRKPRRERLLDVLSDPHTSDSAHLWRAIAKGYRPSHQPTGAPRYPGIRAIGILAPKAARVLHCVSFCHLPLPAAN